MANTDSTKQSAPRRGPATPTKSTSSKAAASKPSTAGKPSKAAAKSNGTAAKPAAKPSKAAEPREPRPLSADAQLVVDTLRASRKPLGRAAFVAAGVKNPTDTAALLVRRGLVEQIDVEGERRTFKLTAAGRKQ